MTLRTRWSWICASALFLGKVLLSGGSSVAEGEPGDAAAVAPRPVLMAQLGNSGWVFFAQFSPDGAHVLTGSDDGTTRLWDAVTGREICSLISFRDGTWAVTDPEGRFDASNAGDVEGLHWVVGDEPIALAQLKDRYYDPGLLAKHLGLS